TRQMVASGDWIDIRLQDQPRYKQPIGIYWLQSVAVSVLGTDCSAPIWVHRLPSLFGATFAVLLTYWVALPLVGARAAFLAGAILAASLILGVEARLAKTDATLLAATLLAQGVLARAYLSFKRPDTAYFTARKKWLYPALFWTALAIGTLVKGPLIIAFVGLTIAGLAVVERSVAFMRILRPVIGFPWFLALTLPWYIAIGFWTDGAFYEKAVGFSIMGKITQGHEGHGAPPLTHFAVFWGIFWPGSLLFALTLKDIWRQRKETWLLFLICWVVPAWITFELVATKLPHYLLPVFPAIAIAAAGILSARQRIASSPVAAQIIRTLLAVLGFAAIAFVMAAAWLAANQNVSLRFTILSVLAILSVAATFRYTARALRDNDVMRFSAGLIVSMMAFYWLLYPSLARIQLLWPGPQIATIIAAQKQCETPYLVSAGYGEASLVFHTRTDILFAAGVNAAVNLANHDCAIALVESQQLTAFRDRLEQMDIAVTEIGRVQGYNIANSRPLDITLFATTKTE
ncbi:MAG: glycosyltransferase family 39 protein, partial [Fimbriimonadaceae bacterium]|nr:glycosyltransferase family 39 protein [Alphaproteobacteria bacterium]